MFGRMSSVQKAAATTAWILGTFVSAVGFAGCDDDHGDATPPAAPSGVGSVTGDTRVFVYWIPNREADLAGYRLWSNSDGGDEYYLIDEFGPDDYYDVDNDVIWYEDYGLQNGTKYWYAVSAFDHDGNRSELSYEYLSDVPRPEGETELNDSVVAPEFSGLDFSRAPVDDSAQRFDDPTTDVYLKFVNGIPFLFPRSVPDVRTVRIQDYGYVYFDVLSYAPLDGYARADSVEAILGHCYAFQIIRSPQDDPIYNYAKLWINALDGDSATVLWGYQEVAGERELAVPDDRQRHQRRILRPDASGEEVTR